MRLLSGTPPRTKNLEHKNSKMGTKSGPVFGASRLPFPLISSQVTPTRGSKSGPVFEFHGFHFFQTLVSVFLCPWAQKTYREIHFRALSKESLPQQETPPSTTDLQLKTTSKPQQPQRLFTHACLTDQTEKKTNSQ